MIEHFFVSNANQSLFLTIMGISLLFGAIKLFKKILFLAIILALLAAFFLIKGVFL